MITIKVYQNKTNHLQIFGSGYGMNGARSRANIKDSNILYFTKLARKRNYKMSVNAVMKPHLNKRDFEVSSLSNSFFLKSINFVEDNGSGTSID